jgi:hypothetical protein
MDVLENALSAMLAECRRPECLVLALSEVAWDERKSLALKRGTVERAIELVAAGLGLDHMAVIRSFIWEGMSDPAGCVAEARRLLALQSRDGEHLPAPWRLVPLLRGFALKHRGVPVPEVPTPVRPTPGPEYRDPPWSRFSEPPQSMRWRMGPGEEYVDNWLLRWRRSSAEERTGWLAEFPAPVEWSDWLAALQTGTPGTD